MPATLIVLAHPDPRSFNGAWAEATARAAQALGHEVLLSDLCAMDFDAVEGPRHYPGFGGAEPFDPLKVQAWASAAQALPRDVADEIAKMRRADLVVLHFPLWWFAPPAVLKGWFDRVLAHGATHDVDRRFDRGLFRGRRALFCVTTGSSAAESGPDGREGDVRMLLWPAAYALRYLGYTVLEPEIVHGVHGYHRGERKMALEARLQGVLAGQELLLAELGARPALRFNADDDFDKDGRLIPGRPSHSPFIRRDP